MSEHTHTPSQSDLQNAVESIDSLSRYGLSRISSIARLAVIAMESPGQSLRTPEDIKHALSAIWGLADEVEGDVTREALAVGCDQRGDGSRYCWQPAGGFDGLTCKGGS